MEASMLACEQRIFYNSPQPSRNDLFLILHCDAGFPIVITDKLEVISQVKKQKEKKERRTKHNTGVFSCIQNCILLEEACANCTAAPFEITEDYFSHLHFFSCICCFTVVCSENCVWPQPHHCVLTILCRWASFFFFWQCSNAYKPHRVSLALPTGVWSVAQSQTSFLTRVGLSGLPIVSLSV